MPHLPGLAFHLGETIDMLRDTVQQFAADEIAPLDDANVERFCDLLVRMTAETDTRYLIVTHNAVTMSRMHRLFGVTMVERGVSRIVSVDLGGAEELLAAE